jgi:hypothetical protein
MKDASRWYASFAGVVMQVRCNFFAIHLLADPVEIPDLDERPSDSVPFLILVRLLPSLSELDGTLKSMVEVSGAEHNYRVVVVVTLSARTVCDQNYEEQSCAVEIHAAGAHGVATQRFRSGAPDLWFKNKHRAQTGVACTELLGA